MDAHHVISIGLAISAAGASMVAVGAWRFLLNPSGGSSTQQRWWTLVGSLVVVAGFLVQVVGQLGR